MFYRRDVLLVVKNHPQWQAGLVNGIGGECKPGEDPLDCMRREFCEETRFSVVDWTFFCHETGPGYSVHYFSHRAEPTELGRPVPPMSNDAGEMLGWVDSDLVLRSRTIVQAVGNLRWLLPLALDWREVRVRAVTDRCITEKPTWS